MEDTGWKQTCISHTSTTAWCVWKMKTQRDKSFLTGTTQAVHMFSMCVWVEVRGSLLSHPQYESNTRHKAERTQVSLTQPRTAL